MRKAGLIICLLVLSPAITHAQETHYKYWVQFKDKDQNSYSLEQPQEFLSERSVNRRIKQGIELNSRDLPVSVAYMDSISNHPLRVLYTSRWMNAAVIQTSDPDMAETLVNYPFVEYTEYLWSTPEKKSRQVHQEPQAEASEADTFYHQVRMLQGHTLHQAGFEGKGVVIAVLDGGFGGLETSGGFDSLFNSGRLLGTRNFVEPDSGFDWTGNGVHGTKVLSIMAGIKENEFMGAATHSSYWLIQTEDSRSEFRIEEANWLAGAELADSAGADIINTSLGYTDAFWDPQQNYSYSDMDGKTSLITRAARYAAERGILVITSAGNEGRPDNPWGYISAPGDADSVLAVGATDAEGNRAVFSSRGPTYDGRVKPDIAALGYQTWLINPEGQVETGNGTSFASPVIAGLAACLWQKYPDAGVFNMLQAIRLSSSRNQYPDSLTGYGLPNFELAGHIITGHEKLPEKAKGLILYPNPARDRLMISSDFLLPGNYIFYIMDVAGRVCQAGELNNTGNEHLMVPVSSLEQGAYFIILKSENMFKQSRFIRVK